LAATYHADQLRTHLSYLEARDRRQDRLAHTLSQGHPATIFLSLNIPGGEKAPPGSKALYHWMLGELTAAIAGVLVLETACDRLGPYALLAADGDALAVKRQCMALETRHPAARLVDLDVYAADGVPIGRAVLALPARACLVCTETAVDCMRAKRHAPGAVIAKAHELLAHFRT
jgi:holo-ACP synthase CitX